MRHTIQDAKAAGFVVTVVLVFLESADDCVERVRQRVLKGGHSVPEPDIRRRYRRALANFWNLYRLLADKWRLYYNGGEGLTQVASGAPDQWEIWDQDLYDLFQRRLEEL